MGTEHTPLPAPRGADITALQTRESGYPADWQAEFDRPGDVQRVMRAVSRRKWLVLLITVLGTTAGFAVTRYLQPHYAARAVLWLENGGRTPDASVIGDGDALANAGWIELVTSNAVLDSVVYEQRTFVRPHSTLDTAIFRGIRAGSRLMPGHYRLVIDPGGRQFRLVDIDAGSIVQRGTIGDSIGTPLGLAWLPPPGTLRPDREIEFTLVAPYDAARELARALDVQLDPAGSFLRIQLEGTNPTTTTTIVNAIADRVVLVAAELKRRKYEELAAILGEQYAHAQRSLGAAEAGQTQFRVRTADMLSRRTAALPANPGTDGDPAVARSFELRFTLEELRRDRLAVENVLATVPDTGLRLEAFTMIGAVQRSPRLQLAIQQTVEKQAELRAMEQRYTAESAPVQRLQAELDVLEQRTVPTLARELAAELAQREAALAPRVDSAFRHVREAPPLALEEARLARDVENAEELFSSIRQRYEEARLALISSLPDVSVLDRAARSHRPAGTWAPFLLALSFVTSLGAAVFGVTVRDRSDQRVRYPEQITRSMRLTILAAVPHSNGRRRVATGSGTVEVIEALRGLRLRLLHAGDPEGPLVLTLTSPAAGEGKSFVSVNLALSFTYAGYRTLLIDGDIRRGVQHYMMGSVLSPGLTDVLADRSTIEAAVRRTSYPGLSFLSSGTRMYRGPELLLSPKLEDLLQGFRQQFSVVLVDSPPLSAGADPLALATATGNVLLVLRSGATDISLAISQLDVLDALGVRTMGAVLNDVNGGSAFRYYTYDVRGYTLSSGDRRPEIIGGGT